MHNRGVVHRDLKPENVLLNRNRKTGELTPIIADFGLAYDLEEKRGRKIGGTTPYMPPEYFESKLPADPDYKGDVWSLGCILFEAAVGKRVWTRCCNEEVEEAEGGFEETIAGESLMKEILQGEFVSDSMYHIETPLSPDFKGVCSRATILQDFAGSLDDTPRADTKTTSLAGKKLADSLQVLFFRYHDELLRPCFERKLADRIDSGELLKRLEQLQQDYKELEAGSRDSKSSRWIRTPANPYRCCKWKELIECLTMLSDLRA